jgi:glycosyltransferase involved in cell wall biosynthesis
MRTIQSLLEQTNSKWCAILVFDGCHPSQSHIKELIENDKRFLYICINRHGSTDYPIHSAAGTVRNIAMNLVVTPWIGFVDDDDTIVPQYVDTLMEEISITPTVQAISFRMIVDNTIVPRLDCNTITDGQMGISFAIQSSLINEGFIFKQFDSEDFYFMNLIDRAQKKIVMSAYLIYYVNTSALDVSLTDATRTEIN